MRWLETDEADDVVNSLAHCRMCLEQVLLNPAEWKWAIISFHSAFQGAMVCHLVGTANVGHLQPTEAKHWLEWYNGNRIGPAPKDRMADPITLFERLAGKKDRIEQSCGGSIDVSCDQIKAFKALNGLRRDFAHFNPMGWSIEISGLPAIFRHCLDMIEAIAIDPWPFRHLECDRRIELTEHCESMRDQLAFLHAKIKN